MSVLANKFAKAYGSDALEVKVLSASPLELIVMLYDGAIVAIQQAKAGIEIQDFSLKSARINKALDIIEGLRVVLDHDKGGDISKNLNDLYEYMKYRLSMANLRNDPAMLDELVGLLSDLHSAWQEIAAQSAQAQPAADGGSYGRV